MIAAHTVLIAELKENMNAHQRIERERDELRIALAESEAKVKELEAENAVQRTEIERYFDPLTTPIGERIAKACGDLRLYINKGPPARPQMENRQRLEQLIELAHKAANLERERNELRERARLADARVAQLNGFRTKIIFAACLRDDITDDAMVDAIARLVSPDGKVPNDGS